MVYEPDPQYRIMYQTTQDSALTPLGEWLSSQDAHAFVITAEIMVYRMQIVNTKSGMIVYDSRNI